jgi:hypothetical protein
MLVKEAVVQRLLVEDELSVVEVAGDDKGVSSGVSSSVDCVLLDWIVQLGEVQSVG